MKKQKYFFLITLFSVFYITACCNCGKTTDENTVKGVIITFGHDPFTKIAVMLEDEKVYVLECDEKINKELWSNQGKHYIIKFSESKVEEGVPILVVENIEQYNYFESK
ncbi:MAG: hypothetical protein AB1521_02140 [Bacteroidota bacterium]